jgi:DNA helicase II / ATP-dependent DNA helicase PcrA
MRLPADSQLSREQKEVLSAPADGTLLIVGPPGSGKTVIAVLRERALKKRRKPVESAVFTNVLTKYTGNKQTFYGWIHNWWRTATRKRFPSHSEIDADETEHWVHDYPKAIDLATNQFRNDLLEKGHWGHLILDEAQDFPPLAHKFLFQIQHKVFGGGDLEKRPSICILADENQRISSRNSTLSQIKQAHAFIEPNDEYLLSQNYRNTKQIAAFASHFYVGLASGIPKSPTASGDKPTVFVADLDSAVNRVVTYANNHPDQEVGVLVQYNKTRKQFFNKLKYRLKDTDTHVQTYGSQPEEHKDASKLVFNKPGVITVLCFASAKGLEFDAVFLPQLQTLRTEGVDSDVVRRNLYVMCSRARSHLFLSIDDDTKQHAIWKLLPPADRWIAE